MTRQFTLAETLRAMADDCQSGQRTGKSDRWALTLRNTADRLDQANRDAQQAIEMADTANRERDAALALLPPDGTVYVAVSDVLLAELGEWSVPVRVRVEQREGNRLTLVFQRDPFEQRRDS